MSQPDKHTPHPIEVESYGIINHLVDLSRFSPWTRPIVQRVIHATADLDYATTMLLTDTAVEAGLKALLERAPIICDVTMLSRGITGYPSTCYLPKLNSHDNFTPRHTSDSTTYQNSYQNRLTRKFDSPGAPPPEVVAGDPKLTRKFDSPGAPPPEVVAGDPKLTRKFDSPGAPPPSMFTNERGTDKNTVPLTLSAQAIRTAAVAHPKGAIVAVGCAPTALFEILKLVEEGSFQPALVVGMPVGFVGASEAKEHLATILPRSSITNRGPKGGSAATAAAINALVRLMRAAENTDG